MFKNLKFLKHKSQTLQSITWNTNLLDEQIGQNYYHSLCTCKVLAFHELIWYVYLVNFSVWNCYYKYDIEKVFSLHELTEYDYWDDFF